MAIDGLSYLDLAIVAKVAETGSFRQTACTFGLGQPSVSRRVARIEDRIGVSLFERRKSGARLTIAGRSFVGRARWILDEIAMAVDEARSVGVASTGALRIGLIASLSQGALRNVVEVFTNAHPNVTLEFIEGEQSELLSLLTHRDSDIVLTAGLEALEMCDALPLAEECLFLAVPKTSCLSRKRLLFWSDVENETFLFSRREPGQEIQEYILQRLSQLGKSLNVRRHRVGREGIMCLVGLGWGVSLVFDHWRGVRYPNVKFVRIGTSEDRVPFSLVWRPENDNPALRRFISLARIEAKRNGVPS